MERVIFRVTVIHALAANSKRSCHSRAGGNPEFTPTNTQNYSDLQT